jgi:hypothetical protein
MCNLVGKAGGFQHCCAKLGRGVHGVWCELPCAFFYSGLVHLRVARNYCAPLAPSILARCVTSLAGLLHGSFAAVHDIQHKATNGRSNIE